MNRTLLSVLGRQTRDSRALRAGLALTALALALPAVAITPTGTSPGSVRSAPHTSPAAAAAAASTVTREGFVQAFDAAGQNIVINSAKFMIGPPVLALLDKRPKPDGLLKFADLKVGMFVRYHVENQRVVELWVMRDPQQTFGTRP